MIGCVMNKTTKELRNDLTEGVRRNRDWKVNNITMSWNQILTGEQVRDSTESRIRVIRWMII